MLERIKICFPIVDTKIISVDFHVVRTSVCFFKGFEIQYKIGTIVEKVSNVHRWWHQLQKQGSEIQEHFWTGRWNSVSSIKFWKFQKSKGKFSILAQKIYFFFEKWGKLKKTKTTKEVLNKIMKRCKACHIFFWSPIRFKRKISVDENVVFIDEISIGINFVNKK